MPFVENSQFARWFRNAAPYVRMHRGKVFVVGLPDECTKVDLGDLAEDIQLLQQLGTKIIVVHGSSDNQSPEQRIAQSSLLAQRLIALISANKSGVQHGLNTTVVTGNYISAKPIGVIEGVDYGMSGKVLKVDSRSIGKQLDEDSVVVISPIGYGKQGDTFDLQFEDVINNVSKAVSADKLIIYSRHLPQNIRHTIYNPQTLADIGYIYINGVLINIVQYACSQGIARVHLLDVHTSGTILQELFSSSGSGLLITNEQTYVIRAAIEDDLNALYHLIEPLIEQGILLPRSRNDIQQIIDDFSVVEQDNIIVACAALHSIDNQYNEIACIATHDEHQDAGYATNLVKFLEQQTQAQGKNKVVIFTTQTIDWFKQRGYQIIDIDQLPQSRVQIYNRERASKAMVKVFNTGSNDA